MIPVEVQQAGLTVTITYHCHSRAQASEFTGAIKEWFARLHAHSKQCLVNMAEGKPCQCKEKLIGPKMEQLLRPKMPVNALQAKGLIGLSKGAFRNRKPTG